MHDGRPQRGRRGQMRTSADRGVGKGPCGRPQARTFFIILACFADAFYG